MELDESGRHLQKESITISFNGDYNQRSYQTATQTPRTVSTSVSVIMCIFVFKQCLSYNKGLFVHSLSFYHI